MNDIVERWIFVKDSDNYEVSSLGRVRNAKTGRILIPQMGPDGRARVTIDIGRHYIHRLVMMSFFDCDLDSRWDVIHKDGNSSNNKLSNLKIVKRNSRLDMMRVVRCRDCINRYNMTICYGQDDDFYCGFGEKRE